MELSDNDKLNLALEIMSDKDVETFEAVCEIAETQGIDIYDALDKYYKEKGE